MKRTLTATAAILAVLAMPAYAQVSGIDTTTTPSTDASIDIQPPAMETGADIMADGQPYPDDALDIETREEAEMAISGPEANAQAGTDVEPQGDTDLDVDTDTSADVGNEFEPEQDLDISSHLDLKIDKQ